MLRVDLPHARPGMTLALPVPNPNAPNRVLLKTNFVLNEAAIERISGIGVRTLWVHYPSLAAVSQYLDPQTFKVQQAVVQRVAEVFEATQNNASAKQDYDVYAAALRGMIDHIATNPRTAVFIGDLAQGNDDLIRHSSAVTYLSVLLGLRLEAYLVRERRHINPTRAKDILNLGLGAMLHDLGLALLDADAKDRWLRAGDEADPAYREHPALGFRALRGHLDPSAGTVVLHHHQRADGSGFAGEDYPVQQGDGIHIYARIAAVADQFDRLRHPPGLPEQPTAFVLHALLQPSLRQRFDPTVLDALYDVVPPYAPGGTLRLSDGRRAVAIDHNPADPCRPVVQILPESHDAASRDEVDPAEAVTLNLMEHPPSLRVVECDGFKVADYNFSASARKAAA